MNEWNILSWIPTQTGPIIHLYMLPNFTKPLLESHSKETPTAQLAPKTRDQILCVDILYLKL